MKWTIFYNQLYFFFVQYHFKSSNIFGVQIILVFGENCNIGIVDCFNGYVGSRSTFYFMCYFQQEEHNTLISSSMEAVSAFIHSRIALDVFS